MPERIFAAKKENIEGMLSFVEEALEKTDCSIKMQTALCVAMEEAFVNVADYAYPEGEGDAKISVDISPETGTAVFCISDKGIAFNPLKKADPELTVPAEQREIGGLGIFIIKKTMDSVEYSRENGENRLIMTKKLERNNQ